MLSKCSENITRCCTALRRASTPLQVKGDNKPRNSPSPSTPSITRQCERTAAQSRRQMEAARLAELFFSILQDAIYNYRGPVHFLFCVFKKLLAAKPTLFTHSPCRRRRRPPGQNVSLCRPSTRQKSRRAPFSISLCLPHRNGESSCSPCSRTQMTSKISGCAGHHERIPPPSPLIPDRRYRD